MVVHITIEDNMPEGGHVRSHTVDGVRFYVVNNLIHYNFNDGCLDRWEVEIDGGGGEAEKKNYYFVMDTKFHDAVSHWVVESAVFLPFFKELRKEFPSLKLILKSEKIYKYLFARFFDIEKDDIVYETEKNVNNMAFFCPPVLAQNNPNSAEGRMKLVDSIIRNFYSTFDLFEIDIQNEIDYVILPRQNKENYKPNDRNVSYGNLIDYFSKSGSVFSSIIVNTDDITDLKDQLRYVKQGKTIILTEGAATIVNCLFCKDKTILVNGQHMKNLADRFPCSRVLVDFLMKRNTMHWFLNENGIIHYIEEQRQLAIVKEE